MELENNNKSNESVSFLCEPSLSVSLSFFLCLTISLPEALVFSLLLSALLIKNIEEIAFFALRAQHSTSLSAAPRDALISKLLRIIVKFYSHTHPYTTAYTEYVRTHINAFLLSKAKANFWRSGLFALFCILFAAGHIFLRYFLTAVLLANAFVPKLNYIWEGAMREECFENKLVWNSIFMRCGCAFTEKFINSEMHKNVASKLICSISLSARTQLAMQTLICKCA